MTPADTAAAPDGRRRDLFWMLGFAVVTVLLWHSIVLFPLRCLVVLVHETGHALAALLTGASIDHLVVRPDESGEVVYRGGWPIVVSAAGLLAAGFTMSGTACLLGIALFAVGEMLASPKMNEYLGVIAPEGKKGLYMGYANMPTAIGWAYGSFMAGDLYGKMGEKAGLALKYLQEHGGVPAGVDRTNAMETLQSSLHLDASAATALLWNTYHPYQLWYPFVVVGLASAVGTWLYSMWVRKAEAGI